MQARAVPVLLLLLLLGGGRLRGETDSLRTGQSSRWRAGVSLGVMRFMNLGGILDIWRKQSLLQHGFHPFEWGQDRTVTEGRKLMVVPGVFIRNTAGTEMGLWVGWNDLSYYEDLIKTPVNFNVDHWFVRAEYTRSTRPRVQPQRPRFGFRYGCALTYGRGSSSYTQEVPFPAGRSESMGRVDARLWRLQPTVLFGYRSQAFTAGLQLFLNLLAVVSGSVSEQVGNNFSDPGGPLTWDYRTERIDEIVFADRLARENLFLSHIQFVVSVPLVPIGRSDDRSIR